MQTHASLWDLHHHKMPSQFLLVGESSEGMQFIQTKTVRERTDTRKKREGRHSHTHNPAAVVAY